MKYKVERTDTADSLIRMIVLCIAENFGNDIALKKLDYLEESIMNLGDNPYIGACGNTACRTSRTVFDWT